MLTCLALIIFLVLAILQLYYFFEKPPTLFLIFKLVPGLLNHIALLRHKQFSVVDNWDYQVRINPTNVALIFEGKSWTYEEIDKESNKVANWALAAGIKCGDTVALLVPNRPAFVWIRLGLTKIGVKVALINTNVFGIPLAHVLTTSTATVLVIGAELLRSFETLDTIPEENNTHTIESVFVTIEEDSGEQQELFDSLQEKYNLRNLSQELAGTSCEDKKNFKEIRKAVQLPDVAWFIYTSGTTGLPKAAKVTHKRIDMFHRFISGLLELSAKDRVFVSLPMYHTNGGVLAFSVWLTGGAVVLCRKFSASRCLDYCRESGATVFIYIGEILRYVLAQPVKESDSHHDLRICIGNGLRPDIWDAVQNRLGIKEVREFYGSTEGNVMLINVDSKKGACGFVPRSKLIPRFLMSIIFKGEIVEYSVPDDEHPRDSKGLCIPAKPGQPGELIGRISTSKFAVSGHFEGYTNKAATDKKILCDVYSKGDKWFRTGDLLKWDAEGYFYFVDRIGDTFRWKGENVATSEIAEVFSTFPGVEEVNVYGVKIKGQEGRAGMASFVPSEGLDNFDFQGLYDFLSKQLPSYGIPVFLRIKSSIQTTTTFKHRKVDLVEEGYDLEKIDDPMYFHSTENRNYIPLDEELVEMIENGKVRV
eukprot:CAMPEP_0174260410 /NCGR_PEP_ID=MMETSP0439-20130205/9697_1 /TAXON_ID=0 /ORGANISM="Stereomyxa ramosa, Strain Chinc5" /LENGTH=646 /DNA_ID=CAMNT_0015344655 /DNA_START=31 /DNA_END=1971 /DNA_ORIENTATION=-